MASTYFIKPQRPKAGISALYYGKIKNSRHGFKSFASLEDAEYAHEVQNKLAEYDLAPRVYSEVGRIRYEKTNTLSGWGYFTEKAELLVCGGNDCTCGYCDFDEIEEYHSGEIEDLVCDIENITEYTFGDCHAANVGYVRRNGKKVLVCIDTGMETIT